MKRNDLLDWARGQWDRVGAWICIALGLIALIVGWFGVSGTVYPAEQIPYILSGGILGIFLLGVGVLLWLSADLRDTWRKLDELDEHLGAAPPAPADPPDETSANGKVRRPRRQAMAS